MPTPEDEFREAILAAVERRVDSILARRGTLFEPQGLRQASAATYRLTNFATGYDGSETVLPFTADMSMMDATTLDSEDLVTM